MAQGTVSTLSARETESRNETPPPQIDALFAAQRAFFRGGTTLPLSFREQQLRALSRALHKHSGMILEAVRSDLGRGQTEGYILDVQTVLTELRHTLRHLKRWLKPRTSLSPLATAISRSTVYRVPLGTNLIISPWNYPVQLALLPLVGAIAAGNVAVLKPSELAPASAEAVATIVDQTYAPEYITTVQGGPETAQALLRKPWDHVFFTGGTAVGRIVAHAAAEHLARCTLELGGKNPTIVMPSADLEVAARRICWGKFLNAGQTCIAPDYLLVHASIHDDLIARIRQTLRQFYSSDPARSPDYSRIINDHHFDRLIRLIQPDKVRIGGGHDRGQRYIAPTVMTDVSLDDDVMREEIFGPILPILKVHTIDDALAIIETKPTPLAFYLFSNEPDEQNHVIERVPFGGGCINNVIMHFADPALPFGGVGSSGTGAYHGRWSVDTFSHLKGVMKSSSLIDPSIKYPPYSEEKLSIIKKLA